VFKAGKAVNLLRRTITTPAHPMLLARTQLLGHHHHVWHPARAISRSVMHSRSTSCRVPLKSPRDSHRHRRHTRWALRATLQALAIATPILTMPAGSFLAHAIRSSPYSTLRRLHDAAVWPATCTLSSTPLILLNGMARTKATTSENGNACCDDTLLPICHDTRFLELLDVPFTYTNLVRHLPFDSLDTLHFTFDSMKRY